MKRLPYKDPFADWPHFVATIAIPNGRKEKREANLFHSPDMADNWAREILDGVSPEQRAAAKRTMREFPNRILAERFAKQWLAGRAPRSPRK